MKFSKREKNYKGYCKDDLMMSGIPESICKPRKTKYYKINVKKSRKNYHIDKTTVITKNK